MRKIIPIYFQKTAIHRKKQPKKKQVGFRFTVIKSGSKVIETVLVARMEEKELEITEKELVDKTDDALDKEHAGDAL